MAKRRLSPRTILLLVMLAVAGILSLYRAITGESLPSLFFASPSRPTVWEPLDLNKYQDNTSGFLEGLKAYNSQDFTEALKVWTPLAEAGDVDSQLLLGYMHSFGFGVNRAPEIAFRWYKAAADQGSPRGMTNLASLYSSGKGVEMNRQKAAQLYRRAAELGDARGMYGLARALYRGYGAQINVAEAGRWARLAVEAGNCEIHQLLAAIHWNAPSGIQEDTKKVYHHALRAKELGCPHEQLETYSRFVLSLEDRQRIEADARAAKD